MVGRPGSGHQYRIPEPLAPQADLHITSDARLASGTFPREANDIGPPRDIR